MSTEFPLLDTVRVASPCSAEWDRMRGDDRARFCEHCGKHVYNLSGMARAEAEALLLEKEGDLCIRLYRRRDGTVLTDNCPVGMLAMRRALLTQIGWVTGLFLAIPGVATVVSRADVPSWTVWQRPPFFTIACFFGIKACEAGNARLSPGPRPAGTSAPVKPSLPGTVSGETNSQ